MTATNVAEVIDARRAEADQLEHLEAAYAAGELDPRAYEAALRAVTVTRFPAGYSLGPCPVGCHADHGPKSEQAVRAEGFRTHEAVLVRLPAGGGREAAVVVAAVDNLDDGIRGPAEVTVFGAECLTPANTRRLTAALMDATDLAEVWNAHRNTGTADLPPEPVYDPLALVGQVMRLLEQDRVPVSVNSLERAVEDAQRLLRDLGVEAVQR